MVFQRRNPVVLVVEDEAMILLDTVDMLENAGVTAIEAANAAKHCPSLRISLASTWYSLTSICPET
ncbi:hypothetical protein PSC71_15770 [Devosia sp. J2-20]|uniref:hypothetical protein n=1 Tax=Devosia sp. J2-20 TaxID=3026161 RepID=UPI002499EF56|nr:hypothetical protein [Devosia sp. J2-20]WDQ98649.1 hypothetical protein PSC71_15770 [Devosia sp. J2-20]